MYHTRYLSLVLCFHGDTVTVITHGNHCILQEGSGTAVDHGLEMAVNSVVGDGNIATNTF